MPPISWSPTPPPTPPTSPSWRGSRTSRTASSAPRSGSFDPPVEPDEPFTALFVGKLIPLHGLETILEAARLDPRLRLRVIGDGQLRPLLASRSANVEHVPWVQYEALPPELHRAGCALGIFGTGAKAARVIPNKAFQALACGVPLVTADTPAARELLVDGESALLVPPGDAGALAEAIAQARGRPGARAAGRRRRPPGVRGRSERARARRALARAARLAAVSARLVLWAAMAAYAAGFSALSALRHRAFETGRFDLGNMVQAVWSTAHGRPLEVTELGGEQVSRLGSHVDPLLAAFGPLWLVWPRPELLLTVQAAAVAAGALPVFWLARRHLRSEPAALGFALAYLLYPPLQWATLSEFHPVVLACPLLLYALWFLDGDRLLPFAAFAAVAVLAKEEIPLVVAGAGIWYGVSRRRWLLGASIAAAGIALTVLAVEVVVPHYAEHPSAFFGRYDEVGGSPAGVVKEALTDPLHVLSVALDGDGLRYLVALLAPLAALPALAPLALLVAAPELAINLLSSLENQTSVVHHYAAGAVPGLMLAAVLGARRLALRRPETVRLLAGVVVGASLVAQYRLGPLPVWEQLPGSSAWPADLIDVSPHDEAARRVLARVPAGEPVSATNTLGAHLSDRRRVLSFPRLLDARWVVVDSRRPSLLDRADAGAEGRRAIERLRRDPRFRLVAADDGVLLFRQALDGHCLRQQVGAESEHEQLGAAVVLGAGEGDRPGEVPDDEPGAREQEQRRGEGETRAAAPGLAQEQEVRDGEAGGEHARGQLLGDAELRQPGRQRVARLLAGLARDGLERAEPGGAVAPRRERGEAGGGDSRRRPGRASGRDGSRQPPAAARGGAAPT